MQAIGVDLGGTKIEVGIVDHQGQLLKSSRLATESAQGPQKIQAKLLKAIKEIIQSNKEPIAGIGVGIAGQVDGQTGVVHFAPNLPDWYEIPLQTTLFEEIKLPVKVMNDVRAITMGEWLFGAGQKASDLVCVFVGTGIGGGVVSGGRLLTGGSNSFAEVGHMAIDVNGPTCGCGNRGCWEAIAGGWGIAKQAQLLAKQDSFASKKLLELCEGKLLNISAKTVVEAYHLKDPLAISLMEAVQNALIIGCANLVNLYNPTHFIIGGGVIDGAPGLIEGIKQGVKEKALSAPCRSLSILPARLGKQVGVVGAAAAIINELAN